MAEVVTVWEGKEWELRVQQLLKLRYSPGEYREVPAEHGGDFGLDGYATDGRVFQAYAPLGRPDVKKLYELQRDKVTTDIAKFIKNKKPIAEMLGDVKVGRWLFVTPRHESASLVSHFARKTKEVRAANLPYVANNFDIAAVDEDFFQVERQQLMSVGAFAIDIPANDVDVLDPDNWPSDMPSLLSVIQAKAQTHPKLTRREDREWFVEEMTRWLIQGQNLLGRLERHAPDVFAGLLEAKAAFESQLQTRCRLGEIPAGQWPISGTRRRWRPQAA